MYQDGGSFAEGYAIGRDTNNNGYGNWGGEWFWIIILLALWGNGNNGFGGFGGGNNFAGYEIGKLATTNDVASGFSTSAIMSNQRDTQLAIQGGFADVQQTLCQGFSGINATVNSVGNTINQGICNLGYTMQGGFNSLGHQISDCCCELKTEMLHNRYLNEKQTCDIIQSNNCNTQRILDFLTGEKISSLQAENAALTAQLSNNAQTNAIVSALSPKAPVPAYPVFPATSFAHPTGVTFGFGGNNDCGCGCNNNY